MKRSDKLYNKLVARKENDALRSLSIINGLIDFSSNDYLGVAQELSLADRIESRLLGITRPNGATGSRLLTGNSRLYDDLEVMLSEIHDSEASLVFNSGYSANLGLISAITDRNDVILYDALSHASIRDGIKLSNAKSFGFSHNDYDDLEKKLIHSKSNGQVGEIYIVTESVFSMDGDEVTLQKLVTLSKNYNAKVILDEAHAVGVFNLGLAQEKNIHEDIFARVITFGKAIGVHGACVLGSNVLKEYLINFSRPFIYTTALSPHSVASVLESYEFVFNTEKGRQLRKELRNRITFFRKQVELLNLTDQFIDSNSAIQSCIIGGNSKTKNIANILEKEGFDVKPILAPTVPEGLERLRYCLHVYNSEEEIEKVLKVLKENLESK